MDASEVISISDSESNASSVILLKLPSNEQEEAPDAGACRQSSVSQNTEGEVVTLSSVSQRSTERCPVTWTDSAKKSHLHFLSSDTYFSPSPRSKVTHWLSENAARYSGTSSLERQPVLEESQLNNLLRSPLESFSQFSANRSSILVRQDYKKSESTKPSPKEHFVSNIRHVNNVNVGSNRTVYLDSSRSDQSSEILNKYIIVGEHVVRNRTVSVDNENFVQQSNNSVAIGNSQPTVESEQSDVDVEEPPTSTPLSVKSLAKSMSSRCNVSANDASSPKSEARRRMKPFTNTPVSPEIQKKIELCEYLKLMNMNPSDATAIEMRQNRRSTRVKHLALMSEKRELERKLNGEVQEGEKKSSLKASDTDSRHSSDNDRGSKISSKKNATPTASSNASKTPSRNVSPSQKPTEESKKSNSKSLERRNSVKAPSKFLQVPEVSTTSISRLKTSEVKNSIQAPATSKETLPKVHDFSYAKVLFRKSEGDAETQRQGNSSNSSSKSEIVTKKSFEQLHMNVESLQPLRNMRSRSDSRESTSSSSFLEDGLNFSFVKSVANIPNIRCDFEQAIKRTLRREIVERITRAESTRGIPEQTHLKTQNSMKNKRAKLSHDSSKRAALRKRKAKASDYAPKSKIPKLNGVLGKMNKKKKVAQKQNVNRPNTRLAKKSKRKQYGSPKHVNRLRSRGRLKQIGIKTILLKEKKKVPKTKLKRKAELKLKLMQKKDFKSTELIQHGNENLNVAKELNNPVIKQVEVADKLEKLEPSPPKPCPSKVKKLLPEAEVWKKCFTSEHRKAYIESIKYVDGGENARKTPVKKGFGKEVQNNVTPEPERTPKETLSIQDEESVRPHGFKTTEGDEPTEPCENINNSVTPTSHASASHSGHSCADRHGPSSEDLEVDQLMSGKQVKDQATQKDCESLLRSGTLRTDTTDSALADRSRCTSSTDPSSTNSSSLQTVESCLEATPSASRQDVIEVPAGWNSTELRTRETPNSTSDAPLCQNDALSAVNQPEVVNIAQIQAITCRYLPANRAEVKSLHHCLTQPKAKPRDKSRNSSPMSRENWTESFGTDRLPKSDRKASQSHTIYLSGNNGAVMKAYYLDFSLIVVQEFLVSFWDQSPLGNVLGAQDMWIPNGHTGRMVLGNGCVHKKSLDVVMSVDNTVAYIELWTKEHKSDKRERPVADIFVAIYLRLSRSGPDKKVLQLENIQGYANDVQYIVLRNSRSIIVSWNVVADDVSSTLVHCYRLSTDYQMVTSITKMQTVGHYVSSLHNIEDCDTLILGCGDCKITLWNLEHGYIVATIDLIEIQPQPRTVWAKCDRGFLFTLHHFNDGVLQLIAINSFDSTWKRLQTYKSEPDHDNLLGVCMENGLLVAFYDSGVSCWSARTGVSVLEGTCEDSGVFLPFGKHVVVVLNNQVYVRHALEYLVTIFPTEDA